MKTGASARIRFDLDAKKSSFAAIARPPTRDDARSVRVVNDGTVRNPGLVSSLMLTHTAYGKSHVRLVKVVRHSGHHDLRDLTVGIRFEGEYDESYTDGNNRDVLPTDTMKNTVYALAARAPVQDPERFGLRLAEHFVERNPRLQRVTIDLVEHHWGRIDAGGREHGSAFMRRGPDQRTASVTATRDDVSIAAGIDDLLIMKTAHSAFSGFPRDEFTTLPETRDRLLATSLTATWHYSSADVPFGPTWRAVRDVLLRTFADHDSESVQHTLHAMGQSVLDSVEPVTSITLVMPNKHHLPIDLSRFGLENRNEIFVATEEPYGRIEATLAR
jgi:urate oxidase